MLQFLRRRIGLKIGFTAALLTFIVTWLTLYILLLLGQLPLAGHLLFLIALGVAVISGLMVWGLVYLFLAWPLKRLNRLMRRIEKGDTLVRMPEEREDELGVLCSSYNRMLAQITDLSVDVIDTGRELNEEVKFKKKLEEKNRIIEQTNMEMEKRLKELTLLFDINQTTTSSLDLDEILEAITEKVGQAMGLSQFAILLFMTNGEKLIVAAEYGFSKEENILGISFEIGEGISGLVVRERKPILIKDTSLDSRYLHYKGQQLSDGTFLSIPILYRDDCIGVFNFNRPEINAFSEQDIKLLEAIADQAAMAIGNARLYTQTRELAISDECTGLYNRRFLVNHLELELTRARQFNNPLPLVKFDVDHFKAYNDRNGHLAGDKVLQSIADIAKQTCRNVDTISHFGSGQFAIILPRLDMGPALAMGEKIRKAISDTPYPKADHLPLGKITVSMGLVSFPEHAEDVTGLLETVDLMLHKAKRAGRDHLCIPD